MIFDYVAESFVQVIGPIVEDRSHLPANDFEQAATVHHTGGDQAINAAVSGEDNTAD